MHNALSRGIFFFFLICAIMVLCSNVYGASGAVKVIALNGTPDITKQGAASSVECKVGLVVDDGDRITTSAGESIEIAFTDDLSNIIKISENSDVYVKKGSEPYAIELLSGEVMALIKKLSPSSTFEVKTPAGLSGARGTGWGSMTDGKRSTFSAFENSIYARGIDAGGNPLGGDLIIGSGFKTVVERFAKPGMLEKLSSAELDRWNSWKSDMADRVRGRGASGEGSSGGQSKFDKADRIDRMTGTERTIDRISDRLDDRDEETRERDTTSSRGSDGSHGLTH